MEHFVDNVGGGRADESAEVARELWGEGGRGLAFQVLEHVVF